MIETRIEGLEELKAKMADLPRKMRQRVLRNALAAGARMVRDEARRNAPVLSVNRRTAYRKPGTVRDAISVRTSKRDRRAGDVGVFVNVRPAKAGKRGAKSPDDPFYWRWLEFGWNPATRKQTAAQRRRLNRAGGPKAVGGLKFLQNAADKLPQALDVFRAQLARWIEKVNASGRVEA